MKTLAFLALVALSALAAFGADVPLTDPHLRYAGRFDWSEPAGPRCAWTASSLTVTVDGGSLFVRLKDTGKNVWQVVVDGEPAAVLTLQDGEHEYLVAENLPAGRRVVELFKRTEAQQGVTQLLGLRLEDSRGLLQPPSEPVRRIEILGDSITCGYGNEAAGRNDPYTPATENGWLTYGAIAARELAADYRCVAWSGKRLRGENNLPALYDRILPNPQEPRWDFAQWTPDVVIINLGTNDFRSKINPEKEDFVSAYVEFIKRIRVLYPGASIYCAQGPMMSNWPAERKPRSTILTYYPEIIERANALGGPPVRFIDFGVQKEENGYGAHYHPSVATHRLMARQLADTLRADLGWR